MESTNEMEGNSNAKLKEILANRISDLFRSNLSLLEIVLPHDKGDNSDNEKDFNALRSRILRVGNDTVRDLDRIFENFVVFELYENKKVIKPEVETIIIDFRKTYTLNKIKGQEK